MISEQKRRVFFSHTLPQCYFEVHDFKIKSATLGIVYFSKKELSDNLTCIHNI